MDPSQRQQRLADLRQKLATLTTEVVKTEDELVALESDGQLTHTSRAGPCSSTCVGMNGTMRFWIRSV
jgi:hypothetical protein